MMKSPTHLKECTEPLTKEDISENKCIGKYDINDENQYVAKVKCECGNDVFEIYTLGISNGGEPCTEEFNGNYFFVVKVNCTSCERKYLLFDAGFHGWDGWICHDDKKAQLPMPTLAKWICRNCSGTKHSLVIMISSQGEADFIEQMGEDFDVNRWQDAFDWFTLDIKCDECGHETVDFVSYETA